MVVCQGMRKGASGTWFGLVWNGTGKWDYSYIVLLNKHSVADSTVWDRYREGERSSFFCFFSASWILPLLVFSAYTSLSTECVRPSFHVGP